MKENEIKEMIQKSILKLQKHLRELHNLKTLAKILSLLSEAVYEASIEKSKSQK